MLSGPTTISAHTNSGLLRITDQIAGSGSLIINRPTTNFVNGFTWLNYSTGSNSFSGGVTLEAGDLTIQGQTGSTSTQSNLGSGTLTIATTGAGLAATGDLRANSPLASAAGNRHGPGGRQRWGDVGAAARHADRHRNGDHRTWRSQHRLSDHRGLPDNHCAGRVSIRRGEHVRGAN